MSGLYYDPGGLLARRASMVLDEIESRPTDFVVETEGRHYSAADLPVLPRSRITGLNAVCLRVDDSDSADDVDRVLIINAEQGQTPRRAADNFLDEYYNLVGRHHAYAMLDAQRPDFGFFNFHRLGSMALELPRAEKLRTVVAFVLYSAALKKVPNSKQSARLYIPRHTSEEIKRVYAEEWQGIARDTIEKLGLDFNSSEAQGWTNFIEEDQRLEKVPFMAAASHLDTARNINEDVTAHLSQLN